MNMEARIRGIGMTSMRTRARLAERLRQSGISNDLVLDAMQQVPRHLFVDEAISSRAYDDCSLPIGEGQTISQPYVVARMTQLAIDKTLGAGQPLQRVLEVGTGSGYQAAVLAHLGCRVYTLERIRNLAHRASDRFRSLGQRDISVRYADGYDGWFGEGPFDVVIVTAAMQELPSQLIDQLRPDGVLIGPVMRDSASDDDQQLVVVTRLEEQEPAVETIEPVRFVPFLGGTC
jgi:protein-L-isoaspartate(D-aspartate) O-methyltransferase